VVGYKNPFTPPVEPGPHHPAWVFFTGSPNLRRPPQPKAQKNFASISDFKLAFAALKA
jgi:hypothetical protein